MDSTNSPKDGLRLIENPTTEFSLDAGSLMLTTLIHPRMGMSLSAK